MRIFSCCLSLLLSTVLLCSTVGAHPGRTDSSGGHYNRKTGEYHYHNGGYASPSESRSEKSSQVVYVTRTGHKYHRDGCRYLKSRIAMPLQEARTEPSQRQLDKTRHQHRQVY